MTRVSYTLGGLIGVALAGAGVLIWGQISGKIPIFGASADTLSPIVITADNTNLNISASPSATDTTITGTPTAEPSATVSPSSESAIDITINNNTLTESFSTQANMDSSKTSAAWDIASREIILAPGQARANAQSIGLGTVNAAHLRVSLNAIESRPAGSQIYYLISTDNGATWQPLVNGFNTTLDQVAGVVKWKVVLDRGSAGTSPSVSQITLNLSGN